MYRSILCVLFLYTLIEYCSLLYDVRRIVVLFAVLIFFSFIWYAISLFSLLSRHTYTLAHHMHTHTISCMHTVQMIVLFTLYIFPLLLFTLDVHFNGIVSIRTVCYIICVIIDSMCKNGNRLVLLLFFFGNFHLSGNILRIDLFAWI